MMCKEKWSEFYVQNQDRLRYLWDPVQNQNVDTLVQRSFRVVKMATAEHSTKCESFWVWGPVHLLRSQTHVAGPTRTNNQPLSQIPRIICRVDIEKIYALHDQLAFLS